MRFWPFTIAQTGMAVLGFGFLAALFGRDVLAGKCAMVFIGIAAFFMQAKTFWIKSGALYRIVMEPKCPASFRLEPVGGKTRNLLWGKQEEKARNNIIFL